MMLMEQQELWSMTSNLLGGVDYKASRKVASGQFLPMGFVPVRMDKLEEASSGRAVQSPRERQEELWQDYFLAPAAWWDIRHEMHSSNSPDFRHKESKEPLWLNSFHKPAWVDAQLAISDSKTRRPSPPTGITATVSGFEGDVSAQTVTSLCEKGQISAAVEALGVLVQTESHVSISLLYSVLRGCVGQKDLVLGRRVHDFVVKVGYASNRFLANHILRMYASEGNLKDAKNVFTRVGKPDAFMWSSMISAYVKHGEPEQAVQLYQLMRRSDVKPDGHVFVAGLQACARAADLESGKQVHFDLLESGVPPNLFVCNSLVDMYAKCGNLEDARRVFDGLDTRDVLSWTAMIAGYAKHGRLEDARTLFDSLETKNVVTWTAMIAGYVEYGFSQEALALYARMESEGVTLADSVTFACLLNACARLAALQQGKQLHSQIVERGLLNGHVLVGNCLIEMYSKCGRLDEARAVFDGLPEKDVVTWNSMINGYGHCNEAYKAIHCFHKMLEAGCQPSGATFTCLLVACSHENLVDEGRHYFNTMVTQHGVTPTIEHYTCMVDLLGRAGLLEEAEKMMLSFEGNDVGLTSLLNACKSHGDIVRGERCFQSLVKMNPQDASAYVLMAKIYSDAGRWADVESTELLRKSAGASKKPATAGIEVNKQVHMFIVGEKRDDLSGKVDRTSACLKEQGSHVPHTELVLKPATEKEKEDELCGHAEKLALAYGLLNTPDGTPLLVTKNLRMCMDCHSSTEIMSRVEKRDIVVRDAHRVHRFVDGSCRCGGRP